jgi:hypothetical protein
VDENTGHVLVHYLYTGTYQTLNNIDVSPIEGVNIEFKSAILAYVAAKTYKLHDLQQLAKHQIEHFGADMHIFNIIDTIKEDSPKLLDDTDWFHDYLKGKAKIAFEADHTIFARDDFFDRINHGALGRLLIKCVVELYNDKVLRLLNTERVAVPQISEKLIPDTQDLLIEEVPAETCFTIEETPAEECPVLEGQGYDVPAEDPVEECREYDVPAETPVEVCQEYDVLAEDPVEVCQEYDVPAETLVEVCREYDVLERTEEFSAEGCLFEEVIEPENKKEEPSYPSSYGKKKGKKMKKIKDIPVKQKAPGKPALESEQAVEAEDSICPARARHMLEGDTWKDCKLCRAVLRQVAIQIARADHTHEDGYEIVDRVLMG